MAIPTIRSVGSTSGTITGAGRNNLVIGETVILSDTNGSNTGFGHVWSLIDKPINSTVTLSTPTSSTSSFIPDVTGSYFIQCLANSTDVSKQILAVPLPNSVARIPAFTETIDYTGSGNTKGWHEALTFFMRAIDSVIGIANTVLGNLLVTAISSPGTPVSGKGNVYIDSTSKVLAIKNDTGAVSHTVKTKSSITHQFLTAIDDAGNVTSGQVAATDITGLSTVAISGAISDLTGIAPPSIISSQIILSGSISGSTSGATTCYISNTPGISSSIPLRYPTSARTISKIRGTLLNMGTSVPVVVKLFKNGSATAQTFTMGASDTAYTKYVDLSHPITFNDGEDFDVQLSCTTDASAGSTDVSIILE